ncbi:hypothetical protein [Microbacterium enclense]|uniref:hypothetical protein n=1 Tax=Microbacterium enclense TaxID=993073 RepID=UPI003F80A241
MRRRDPLSRLSSPGYWASREKRERWSLGLSLIASRVKNYLVEFRDRSRIALELGKQSLPALLGALALLGILSVGSALISPASVESIAWLGSEVKDDTYRDLVAAGVGAIAALLGLYYATVGVVASTVYQNVPATIRNLFVQEPSGVVYVQGVVRALVFGIALLTLAAVGTDPTPLTIGAFALLSMNAVLRLMILGGQIFNFFDPTALAKTLRLRLLRAVKSVTSSAGAKSAAVQTVARRTARETLTTYEQLTVLLEDRKGGSSEGPRRVINQLLSAAGEYSAKKALIPSTSEWWESQPDHPNWMTAGSMELEMARMTATGIAAKPVSNRLWVEQAVARVLSRALRNALRSGGSPSVLAYAGRVTSLAGRMGARLQIDEALVIERAWVSVAGELATSAAQSGEGPGGDLNRLAAAEQTVLPLTNLWLGFVDGADAVAKVNLAQLVERGLQNPELIYKAGLPRSTIELLEDFLTRSRQEISAEGRAITQGWWFEHYLARSLASHLRSNYDRIVSITRAVADSLETSISREHHEAATTIAIASLELHHKIEAHHHVVESAFDNLSRRRHANTGDKSWSEAPDDASWAVELRQRSWQAIATALPHLRRPKHDPLRPDLHGQSYQVLFSATFACILNGCNELGASLFRALLAEADLVRARVSTDLADRDELTRIGYMLEPILGLMELSGYARLMQEVDAGGIWNDVRAAWDEILEANAGAAELLLAAETHAAQVLAPGPGQLARTNRIQQLNGVLKERGLRRRRRGHRAQSTSALHPVVAAFGSEGMPRFELADLFIVEYLLDYLKQDADLPVRAESLRRTLQRQQDLPRHQSGEDSAEQPENAEDLEGE